MSIDPKVLAEQFERLRALNYFPSDESVQKEIRNAMKSAPNEILLTAVVNEWLKTHTERPTPADIYRLIRQEMESNDTQRYWKPEDEAKPNCAACQDSGLSGGTKTNPWAFCECPRGRARQHNEPEVVDKSNAVREKMFAHKPSTEAGRNTRDSAFTPARQSVREQILTRLDGESPR